MYFHIMIGTGSYTTSTTNMYNNTDFTYLARFVQIHVHGTIDVAVRHVQQFQNIGRGQLTTRGTSDLFNGAVGPFADGVFLRQHWRRWRWWCVAGTGWWRLVMRGVKK